MSFPIISSTIRATESIFDGISLLANITVDGINSLAEEAKEDKKIKAFRKESEMPAKLLRIEADTKAEMLSSYKSLKKTLGDADYDDSVKAADEILKKFEDFRVKD